eukprot:gnl/MRDRNA2_/MRDRNA2_150345_c0_seq1.p1 gnl/MRDRNA2_/MRDRNA2_150345_c0~~gnl/MRDRNA2_/MRDRNA2_150345_c0_seq1.p1  ORF type:complete len:142 (+),score=25.77 gnl/MRDRNA2_/MRDRNA2_150345_c0_seq1:65-427(+)
MATKEILECVDDEEGLPMLRLADAARKVTITLRGPMGKVTSFKSQLVPTVGGTVCTAPHYYDPYDSFDWGAGVGTEGNVKLVAEVVGAKNIVQEEVWSIELVGGRATRFEMVSEVKAATR